MDRGAWWATVLGFAELDTTERLLGSQKREKMTLRVRQICQLKLHVT